MTATPVVRLAGVSKSFTPKGTEAVPVLRAVDLTIWPGEKASLVGPSGSGKSTLLSLMAGLLRPDAGTLEVDGIPMGRWREHDRALVRARRVGIALQADNLIPFLSAAENVELALGFGRRRTRRRTRARALDLLERLGVAHRARHRPRHLSGGEAQRVALAVALANDPALLLADEVVAALDEQTAADVVAAVLAADTAVLYVTHDVALADRVATRYELVEAGVRAR